MKLKATPFEAIRCGEKTVECRLYDEKRQKVALGDLLTFSLIDDEVQHVTVKVVGLLRYATFADMFSHNDPRKFGGTDARQPTEALLTYYDQQRQDAYGVLGIEFELE